MTPAQLFHAMEATWPPAAHHPLGPFLLRDGAGGGKRVSAASAEGPWTDADLTAAEAAMAEPLFLIRPGDEALDAALAERGYQRIDPVVAYAAPAAHLAAEPPAHMTTFPHWPPMEIARQLWAEGHIGPARLAVMDRAAGAKCAILSRASDRASGVAFVACDGPMAMLHALEVSPALRRQGSAHNILRAAAAWALDNGADTLALVVTEANANARRLYASLGMTIVGQYHYRQK
ncbi:MAG: GNAT family N-acetyltransferase [Rhodobacteraceae bacterium]|nr:GNAT family N-acetyltransferase [Paracoccaceae bacterium]